MPAVALFSKPNGAPIASTHSPTLSERDSPSLTVGRSLAEIFRIAMSDLGSTPTTLAVYSRRSVRRTVTSLAPFTTCALVMITPSGRMMNPDPSPRIGCGCGGWRCGCGGRDRSALCGRLGRGDGQSGGGRAENCGNERLPDELEHVHYLAPSVKAVVLMHIIGKPAYGSLKGGLSLPVS